MLVAPSPSPPAPLPGGPGRGELVSLKVSALEWVIDQHQVSTVLRSGIKSDPNRGDDPEYVVRLVGQVVRVSLEAVKIVKGLPGEFEPKGNEAGASG